MKEFVFGVVLSLMSSSAIAQSIIDATEFVRYQGSGSGSHGGNSVRYRVELATPLALQAAKMFSDVDPKVSARFVAELETKEMVQVLPASMVQVEISRKLQKVPAATENYPGALVRISRELNQDVHDLGDFVFMILHEVCHHWETDDIQCDDLSSRMLNYAKGDPEFRRKLKRSSTFQLARNWLKQQEKTHQYVIIELLLFLRSRILRKDLKLGVYLDELYSGATMSQLFKKYGREGRSLSQKDGDLLLLFYLKVGFQIAHPREFPNGYRGKKLYLYNEDREGELAYYHFRNPLDVREHHEPIIALLEENFTEKLIWEYYSFPASRNR